MVKGQQKSSSLGAGGCALKLKGERMLFGLQTLPTPSGWSDANEGKWDILPTGRVSDQPGIQVPEEGGKLG